MGVLLAPVPVLHSRIAPIDGVLADIGVRAGGTVAAVVIGLVMLLIAGQLYRGKRSAWVLAVLLIAGAVAMSILRGPHPVAAILLAALLVALVWARDDFVAEPDPPSIWAAARFVPVWLGAVVLYGVVALVLERRKIAEGLDAGGMLETVFGGLIGLDGPYTFEDPGFARFFPASLLALGIAGLIILAYLVFRPIAERAAASPSDRARAEALVHEYGWDTLAYFALRDDKSLFFSSDGKAMIAYTYLQGHALASGDPIGAPGSIPLVVDEFRAFCATRGWRVAFLAVRESDLPLYEERGMSGVYIGDEAIIRCDRLDLSASGMKKVRQAVQHVARDHELELIRESAAGPGLVEELNAISRRWRGTEPERGFTMALSQDVSGDSADMVLAIARPKGGGAPVGFLRLVPCVGGSPGYSLDLMRRDPKAPNGTTEFLIASAAEELGRRGVVRLSMNFAAMGRLFEADAERGARDRALRWVVGKLNPYFQIQSLHDFNAKFEPEWLPRAIVVEDAVDVPHVGLLYAGVEGFVRIPVLGPMLVPPVVAAA